MKRILALAGLFASVATAAFAQGSNGQILYAGDFGQWSLPQGTTPANGAIQWNASICTVNPLGFQFTAPKVGRPLLILDGVPSLSEIVIPTTVIITASTCTVSATMAHTHYTYQVRSGTAGLQEALDYSSGLSTGSLVAVTTGWSSGGGTSGMLTGRTGSATVSFIDERNSCFVPYTWNGSTYAAGSSFCNGGGGSSALIQTNTISNTLQNLLNFQSPAAFNGVSFNFSNPSGGVETLAISGTLTNAGLANPFTTVGGTTCTLGAACNPPYVLLNDASPQAMAGSLSTPGIFNATQGFQYAGAAPSGHVLLGNGTNYIDSAFPVVSSINSTSGAFTFSFSAGAGSCSGTTCTFTGSGSGGGSVTNFTTGTWVPWETPSVATSTTTPALSVAATTGLTANQFLATPNGSTGAVGLRAIVAADVPTLNQATTSTAANLSGTPALPNGTSASTQTLGDNSTKLATDAFVLANAGTGTISGQTANCAVMAATATTATSPFPLCLVSGVATFSVPVAVSGTTHGITIAAGTQLAGGAGLLAIASDTSVGKFMVNENNGGYVQGCTATNGACGSNIANVQITTGTGAVSATCSSNTLSSAVTMAGLATTNGLLFTPTTDISSVAGWDTGALYFAPVLGSGSFQWRLCTGNPSGTTPGSSVTWNVSAR